MKLCPDCNASPLPFVMIAVIVGVIGFMTWLMLGLSDWEGGPRLAATAGVSAAVGLALWHYVMSCLRRHCRHQRDAHRLHGHADNAQRLSPSSSHV
jgi:hypothetical protein